MTSCVQIQSGLSVAKKALALVLLAALAPVSTAQSIPEILNIIYSATNGDSWMDNDGWRDDTTNSYCSWSGITCYPVNRFHELYNQIETLDLSSNGLIGALPKDVFRIPFLSNLILRDNPDLTIRFDDMEHATMLNKLVISNTVIESFDNLNGPELREFHITGCSLHMPFPTEIINLKKLEALYANYNFFYGFIPDEIGSMVNLVELYLLENDFEGPIPDSIGNLVNLEILALSDNSLAGPVPSDALNKLVNLKILSLADNALVENIPSLNALSSIREVYLDNNLFTGQIPMNFLSSAPKDQVMILDLSNNKLEGTFGAARMKDFFSVNLDITGNQFTSIDSTLCQKTEWMSGAVGDYGCDGIVCPVGSWAPTGRRTPEFTCVPGCLSATFMGADNCDGDKITILREFYQALRGDNWEANNWFVSENECEWTGITCDNDTERNIIGISLNNMKLSGTVPSSIFSFYWLETIDLSDNFITFKFDGIRKLQNLKVLDLSSTGLDSWENIDQLQQTSIMELYMSNNNIESTISSAIYQLSNLRIFKMANNKLQGTLSPNIGRLTNLEELHLFGNNLTGEIPEEIGNLRDTLRMIILSENDFTGLIPYSLNFMTNLVNLFIQQKRNTKGGLTGSVPHFSGSPKLAYLNLSGNSLSGSLPSNFMENSERLGKEIYVDLSSNKIQGQIPSTWEMFGYLNINLANNMIDHIHSNLCTMKGWQNGALGALDGCDPILCKAGSFNANGRATTGNGCVPCPSAQFYGTTKCDDLGDDEIWWILETFYASTNGESWSGGNGWLQSSDPCDGTWTGIKCDNDKVNILEIDLAESGLTGTPDDMIFNLPRLQTLNLSYNDIKFSFDGIGAAHDLRVLKLSGTQVSSIDGIGQAVSLNELHLTDNNLSGKIPDELFNLINLRGLYMNYNRFAGRLSSRIGQLVNLENLFLLGNDLTGQIPSSIGNLKQMKVLTLSENRFVGTIPESINQMEKLEVLAIQGKSMIIPARQRRKLQYQPSRSQVPGLTGALPSLNGLKNLESLFLAFNNLSGKIPYDFLSGILDKSKTITIDLEGNYLAGTVPASLTQFDDLNLSIGSNRFSDIAPGLCKMTKWLQGGIGTFSCDGLLCPKNTFSQTGRRTESGVCEPCPENSVAPFMGSVQCVTVEQQEFENERSILKLLFDNLEGTGWHSKNNWYDDTVTFCDWHGITCTSDRKSVQAIHLASNGLKGTLPDVVFDLPNLLELNLASNEVSFNFGNIGNAKRLEYLNIDENGIDTLNGIQNASALRFLHASNNSFTKFPTEIISLANLQVLYLSFHTFETTIPNLSGLSQLSFFACKRCGFHGSLPSWLGNFEKLRYLSLSGNKLTGQIPTSLSLIPSLTHLDISDQSPRGGGLTGSIPSFSTLGSLSELYLHKNKLSGPISDDFLANTTASSVTVDLRMNSITGSVPRSLFGRFGDLTLLLAGNQIEEISDTICSTPPGNWNQGDLVEYGCDGLLCKKGFYSPIGRATSGYQCKVCNVSGDSNAQNYLGNTKCGTNLIVQALEAFYFALSGPDWINNMGWTENDAFCSWYGIECDTAGNIVGIDLAANNLVGKVPKDIYQITSLTYIMLKENRVTMDFNGIEKLTLLESLNLSSTGMSSISGIGAALSLKELHFTSNELTSIPNELFNLVNLERLLLNFNKIQGTLSSRIGQLQSLKELYMFRNKLSGNLPKEIANLKNIKVLGLGENDFTGEIPEGLSDLQNVEVIALQHFSGNGADAGAPIVGSSEAGLSGKVPAFDNNPKLREIYLSFNNLSGTISNSFLRAIDSKSDDIIVDLAGNAITGSIPLSLNQFTRLNLYLAGNQITQMSESTCSNWGWMNGRVENTGCDAILCPIGFYNQFGRQTTDGNPCEPCPFTFTASYYGSTSCAPDDTDYNEREILTKFYHATGGSRWLDADNWLKDKVSICDWHGILCESQASEEGSMVVTEIHLSSNKLQGTVPPQIFNLRHLRMFNVRDNKVDVQLYAMREGPALQELYLDYTDLSSLKGIGRAKNLKTLHVQQNNLRGEQIPDELFTLSGLKHLFISDSNISGPLSSKIGNLKQLEDLYCHGNDLSGEIPESIGDLSNLEVLVLSENLFVGPLPESVSQLMKLESLFIDSFTRRSAGLSGPLPSFEGMPVLRQLYLNSNSFTGTIPESFLSTEELMMRDSLSPQAIAALARRKQRINVGLQGNRLEGSIPASLAEFQRLNIDLSDNLITSIDEELCFVDPWMGGDVGNYGCNAILCPPGYFNLYGRQTNARSPCNVCEGAEQSQYFGATKCLSEIKQKEREILELFYKKCGGDNWKNKGGWLQEGTDICNWHGINCSNGGSVDTIDLGANNVIGTPPSEIFELENLTYLWLYSNPIKFSFKGINRARRLESLLLDSTGLESLEGIGSAYQLVDLDIRFNNLKGQIPGEISNLVNLENLSLSDNKFTGSLPTLSRMHRLKSLRAANNNLSGLLPSFEESYMLKTLDLSGNKISGKIPSSFLESVDPEESIYIDLSRNRIEGSIPGELARFEKMTIYLKDNFLFGVGRDICDNVAWNDGDVGRYNCDAIVCPAGTYAPGTGRQSLGGSKCIDCKVARFYGQSQCVDLQEYYSSAISRGMRPLLSLLVTGITLLLVY